MGLQLCWPSESIWKRLNCIFLPSLVCRLFAEGPGLLIGLSLDAGCSEQLQQAAASSCILWARPAATSVCLPLLREDKEDSLVATVASRAAVCSFMVNCLGRVNVALWAPQLNGASRKVCGKNPLQ